MRILAIAEHRQGKWNNTSFEMLAAAQQIAGETSSTVSAVVIGKGVASIVGGGAVAILYERYGTWSVAFGGCAVMALVTGLIAFALTGIWAKSQPIARRVAVATDS